MYVACFWRTLVLNSNCFVQVKEMFPQLMDKLSGEKSQEAEELMARAIASFDELNNCLEMAMQACT